MNQIEIDYNALSNHELDKLIQTRIFPFPEGRCRVCGWPFERSMVAGCTPDNCSQRARSPMKRADEPPQYSASLEMAWDLVNEAKGLAESDSPKLISLVSELGQMARAAGCWDEGLFWFLGACDNPARAIAIAALRALDKTEEAAA